MVNPKLEDLILKGTAEYRVFNHAFGMFGTLPLPTGKVGIIVDIIWYPFLNPIKKSDTPPTPAVGQATWNVDDGCSPTTGTLTIPGVGTVNLTLDKLNLGVGLLQLNAFLAINAPGWSALATIDILTGAITYLITTVTPGTPFNGITPIFTTLSPSIIILGDAKRYAVLASSTITNTGNTVITGGDCGNVGLYPGTSVVGFPPGVVTPPGLVEIFPNPNPGNGQLSANTAFVQINALPGAVDLTGQVLGTGGVIPLLNPGLYKFTSSAQITGVLTLDGPGDYIFQIGSTLTTAPSASIVLINGATADRIFWAVGSSATIDTSTIFKGIIIALASITVNNSATVDGKLLALTGAVTLDNNIINATCEACIYTTSVLNFVGGSDAITATTYGDLFNYNEYQLKIDGKKSKNYYHFRNSMKFKWFNGLINNEALFGVPGIKLTDPIDNTVLKENFLIQPDLPTILNTYLVCEEYVKLTISRNAQIFDMVNNMGFINNRADEQNSPNGIQNRTVLRQSRMADTLGNFQEYQPPQKVNTGVPNLGDRLKENYTQDYTPDSELTEPSGLNFPNPDLANLTPYCTHPLLTLGIVIVNKTDFDKLQNS